MDYWLLKAWTITIDGWRRFKNPPLRGQNFNKRGQKMKIELTEKEVKLLKQIIRDAGSELLGLTAKRKLLGEKATEETLKRHRDVCNLLDKINTVVYK